MTGKYRISHMGFGPLSRTGRAVRSKHRIGFMLSSGVRIRRGRPLEVDASTVKTEVEVLAGGIDAAAISVIRLSDDHQFTSGQELQKSMLEAEEAPEPEVSPMPEPEPEVEEELDDEAFEPEDEPEVEEEVEEEEPEDEDEADEEDPVDEDELVKE